MGKSIVFMYQEDPIHFFEQKWPSSAYFKSRNQSRLQTNERTDGRTDERSDKCTSWSVVTAKNSVIKHLWQKVFSFIHDTSYLYVRILTERLNPQKLSAQSKTFSQPHWQADPLFPRLLPGGSHPSSTTNLQIL